MKYTIQDVAKKAKVSTATVSRVLNNQPGFSEKTRQKVLQVIEELGYQPNALARGLVNKRTHTIAMLVPDLTSTLAMELLKGVEKEAHAKGNSVILCNTESGGIKTLDYLKVLSEKRIDGIIYTSHVLEEKYYDYIKKMNVPLVLLATQSDRFPVPFVKVNDRAAAFSATSYLIQKGHRRIGMISGGEEDVIAGVPRIDGFKAALKTNGIPVDERLIIRTDGFFFEDGIKGFQELMDRDSTITAVFAGSDDIAVGVISAANKLGIKIPDQLSVIGYDNLKIAEMSIPSLTTVAQPLVEMGKKAAEMVIEMIVTEKRMESHYFPFKIIERDSVKDLTQ